MQQWFEVCYQLHASAAAVLLSLRQLLHLQPRVLQTLLEVAGVLSLPSFSLGALLQLFSQANHTVPQTQHQHLHIIKVGQAGEAVQGTQCDTWLCEEMNECIPSSHLKPLNLPSLKLQFIFQVTHSRLLFADNAAPHSGRLQKLHP